MVSYFRALPLLLLLFVSVASAFTRDFDEDATPDMVDCAPRLLPLTTCAPFVQGNMPLPAQSCCDSILDLYDELPDCLCVVINNTNVPSFPINRTLALQLPALCSLNANISSCRGFASTHDSSQSQVSKGVPASEISSPIAASPLLAAAPASTKGFGLTQNVNASAKLKVDGLVFLVMLAVSPWLEIF